MQGLEKRYERCCLRWIQIFPVCRHIPASLDHLPDELVLRKPYSNAVQSWTSLPARAREGMAVAALFDLKDERALPFKRRRAVQKSHRHWIAAPGVHVWTPGGELGEM